MLLSLCRSRLYYKHEDPKQTDLEIMQLIDKIHALHPYYGVPRMTRMLREQGFVLGKWKVRRLMRNVRPHQSLQYRRPINVFKAIA